VSAPGLGGRRARPESLVRRLIWLAAGWSLALLLGTGVALSIFFAHAAMSRFEKGLVDVTDALYAGSSVGEGQTVLAPALTDARALRAYSGRYWQISEPANRRVRPLVRSRSLWDSEMAVPPDLLGKVEKNAGAPFFYDALGPAKEKLRAVAVESRLPGRVQPVLFMAAEDRGPVDADIHRFALVTAATLAVLGAGLVAAVFIQVRVGLSPLFAMVREVSEVRVGKAERLVRAYPEELAPLAGELNALLDHNQDVVERQRTHVGNLAHALKTPISVMLAEAEAKRSPLAEVVIRQAEAMRGHVEHHLRRARAAARSQGSGERTSVEPVLEEIARTLARVYRTVDLDWDAIKGLAFAGERQDLMEMAGNLMENACKWSRGQVMVRAEAASGQRGLLRILVEDDGPGLPADQRAAVLKRGERLDESAPGSGLGLSIVDELARAYGGKVELADSELGGLKAVLELPAAEA
jgi:signal transduction histidine kinase